MMLVAVGSVWVDPGAVEAVLEAALGIELVLRSGQRVFSDGVSPGEAARLLAYDDDLLEGFVVEERHA